MQAAQCKRHRKRHDQGSWNSPLFLGLLYLATMGAVTAGIIGLVTMFTAEVANNKKILGAQTTIKSQIAIKERIQQLEEVAKKTNSGLVRLEIDKLGGFL